jgi:hypothetical protein
MAEKLKFNICELETSCLPNADIQDLNNRVREKISDALQYSSIHWSNHLCSNLVPVGTTVSALLITFLRGVQLLYWLEVLSLMGRVPVAIWALRLLKAGFKVCALVSVKVTADESSMCRTSKVIRVQLMTHCALSWLSSPRFPQAPRISTSLVLHSCQ